MTLEVYEIEPSGVAVEIFWPDFEFLNKEFLNKECLNKDGQSG